MSEAARALESAGVPSDDSRRDAVRLARWLLNWDETQWLLRRAEPAPHTFAAQFEAAIARRRRREPLAYILGEREFYGRAFRVAPGVLVPRPETELIVESALARLPPDSSAAVIDVGTGTGCLAITMALERPGLRITGIDASAAALAVARENVRRHGVLERLPLREADLLHGVAGSVDMIVSNPPYVAERDRPSLAPEVLDYEPAEALFAGPDGLDVIRALVPAAANVLAPGGWLIFEFGWGQAEAVRKLVESTAGLVLADVRRDLQQIPRVAIAQRLPAAVR